MRWPIATGSSMESAAFQIHDELVRRSLYKRASHRFVIELKDRTDQDVGTVRAFWLLVGSVALGLGLAAIGFAFVSGLTGTFTACNVGGLIRDRSALGGPAAVANIGPSVPRL